MEAEMTNDFGELLNKFQNRVLHGTYMDASELEDIARLGIAIQKYELTERAVESGLSLHPDSNLLKSAKIDYLILTEQISKLKEMVETTTISDINAIIIRYALSFVSNSKSKRKKIIREFLASPKLTVKTLRRFNTIATSFFDTEICNKEYYNAIISTSSMLESSSMIEITTMLEVLEQYDKCKFFTRMAIDAFPYSSSLWNTLSRNHIALLQFDSAKEDIYYSENIDGYTAELVISKYMLLIKSGADKNEELKFIDEFYSYLSFNMNVMRRKAQVLLDLGREKEALKLLKKDKENYHSNAAFLLNYYIEKGELDKGVKHAMEYIEKHPDTYMSYSLLIAISLASKDPEDVSEKIIDKALLLSPDDHRFLEEKANILFSREDMTGGVECLMKILHKDPSNMAVARMIYTAYMKMGMTKEMEKLNKIVSLSIRKKMQLTNHRNTQELKKNVSEFVDEINTFLSL